MNKPRIYLKKYSSRSYWSVSPAARAYRNLPTAERVRWEAAYKYASRLNNIESMRVTAQHYLNKYGTERLTMP